MSEIVLEYILWGLVAAAATATVITATLEVAHQRATTAIGGDGE